MSAWTSLNGCWRRVASRNSCREGDVNGANAVVAIAGMITGLLITGAIVWGIVQLVRIRYQAKLADPGLSGEVAQLRDHVDLLQQQLSETQERLDFTERLLTRGRDAHEAR